MKTKTLFSMMLIFAFVVHFSSCSNETASYVPQDVTVVLDYTLVKSGNLTKASGSDVYTDFYGKYIETKQLTPATYTLTFTNKETGAIATINGKWNKKDGIRLPEGTYEVIGQSTPIEKDYVEWSDSVYLAFNETVVISKDAVALTLTANYDSWLLLLDSANTTNVSCKCTGLTSTKGKLSSDENTFWVFMQETYRNERSHDYYLVVTRQDEQQSTIELLDIPFEKGKYYYFNDMTNSFNIPHMESGN